MAGDWIPMRTDLWDCPQVVRILSAMCPQDVHDLSERVRKKSEIIGALYRTWSLFDAFSDDGILHGYDAATLNETLGIENWAENLQHVGWLTVEPQSLTMPEFTRWLGKSAKRRLRDVQRKREDREKCPQSVRKVSAKKKTKSGPQKRREEKSIKPLKSPKGDSRFDAFWNVVHIKVGKRSAERAFAKAVKQFAGETGTTLDAAASEITSSMAAFAKTPSAKPRDRSPIHPATWLNSGRYTDDRSAWEMNGHNPESDAQRKRDEERRHAAEENAEREADRKRAEAERANGDVSLKWTPKVKKP